MVAAPERYPDDHIHKGWKGIVSFLGCSERKAHQLAYHPEEGVLPMPVDKDPVHGVIMIHGRYRLWVGMERHHVRKARALAQAKRRPPATAA